MANLASTVTQPTGRSFFSFLKRNSDGLYWHPGNAAFQAFNPSTADEATRNPYRVSYVEQAATPGQYTWTLEVTLFIDGSYSFTSHELSNGTEFTAIVARTVTISNGVVDDGVLRIEVQSNPGATLFIFLERLSDGLFLHPGTGEFKLFDLAGAPAAERATFRSSFTEGAGGTYTVEVTTATYPDGTYRVYSRELVSGVEIIAGETTDVLVSNGSVAQGVALGTVALTHSTGDADKYRYTTAGGVGIQGAIVQVFLKADHDSGDTTKVKGVTYTDKYGRWETAVTVPVGNTYSVVFSKYGAYGPDVVEVIV